MTFTTPLGLLALLAVPAIVTIHLFRRRHPVRPVAGLFLWQATQQSPHEGTRISRLPVTTSLLLECLAALALALILAGARVSTAGASPHLVVLLDDSASMAAVNARGESARDRAVRRVLSELDRLGGAARITVVRSGARPSVLSGPASLSIEARPVIEAWRPEAPHHSLALGIQLARELAGRTGRLMVLSDLPPAARGEPSPDQALWVALGEPLDNVGVTSAERSLSLDESGGAILLTLGNYSASPARRRLDVSAGGKSVVVRELDVPPGVSSVTLPLPAGLPAVRAALSDDALMRDNEVTLAEPRPRVVGVENLLPEGRGRDALAKALAALASVTSTQDGHLAFGAAAALAAPESPGIWRVGFGRPPAAWLAPGETRDFIGSFVLEKRHPLLLGVTLGGVVWSGASPTVPGALHPLVSAGDQLLVGTPAAGSGRQAEPAILFNLDLDRTNLIRTPDWPILVSNLIEMRRHDLPGPERWNYRVGEWVRVRLGRDPSGPVRLRSGGVERPLPAGRQLEFAAPSPGGLAAGVRRGHRAVRARRELPRRIGEQPAPAIHRRRRRAGAGRRAARRERRILGPVVLAVAHRWCDRDAPRLVPAAGQPQPRMTRISLLFPQLLLLIVPLVAVYLWRARAPALGGLVRVLILALFTLLAAVPLVPRGGKGVDVVIVVDLSRSMPADTAGRVLEIVRIVEERRESGDRVGIVTYGREPRIERLPQALGQASAFVQEVDRDGSDLGTAIGLAASLVPRGRPGRVIVLSDGESNGTSVTAAAHDAAARGLPIDFRLFGRGEAADIAVESLDLPGMVDEREPFQFSASVRTDRTVATEAVLLRDEVEIARTSATFPPGVTQLVFRDLIDRPGVARYRLHLAARGDRVPENNVGVGAVRVEAPATILVVNASGRPDNLSRALESGKLAVSTVTPSALPRDLAGLLAFRAVILENVPAGEIGPQALDTLAHFASDIGGGVLVTGGTASFGVGGYFKSALEAYLPVSMEIKNEHRKLSLAMAVVLDRSGSMAAPVGDGRTKMDLANAGTCAAIDTLGPFDQVGVIAVDSAPHVVSPLTSASEKDAICGEVRRIQSMGGGIFTYTALVSAATMVQESDKGTRHIVLFADAADAEEPGDYQRLLATLEPLGITVSVIGLGSESDTDAAFLKDVAARGHGRMHFTASADDLPRLFAEEAITVARSSFVTEPTAARALPDLVLLGELPPSAFPGVDGYNLAYLRPGATLGVVTTDEYKAPILAFWHRGLGRVAALTAEVDGAYSARLARWKDFPGFAVGLGRWLLGGDPPAGVRASLERDGAQGIVRVELDPGRTRGGPDDIRAATATVVPPGAGPAGQSQRLPLAWVGGDQLEARFPVHRDGMYLGAVQLGNGVVLPLAPLSLPYSPEFEPRVDPAEGRNTLREIARISGGVERTTWDDVFTSSRMWNRQVRDAIIPLTLALLVLHVVEIGGRRLLLFAAAREWLRTVRFPNLRRVWPERRGRPAGPRADAGPGSSQPASVAGEVPPNLAPSPPRGSPLARAKAKARDRMR